MTLSVKKRRFIVIVFVLVFIVLAPTIVFYANGNILNKDWDILRTGGIYIHSAENDSEIFLNGKLKQTTNLFRRDVLIKNLHTGSYTVLIRKKDFNEWTNTVQVEKGMVSDLRVFMLPKEIMVKEVKPYLDLDTDLSATSTVLKPKIDPEYGIVKKLFTNKIEYPILNRRLSLSFVDNEIYLDWIGEESSIPKIFCDGQKCLKRIMVYRSAEKIKQLDFFPNESEIVLFATNDSVYAIEARFNPSKIPQLIYKGKAPEFRVSDDNLTYIKDGDFYGQVQI